MNLSKEWYRKEATVYEEEQTHRTTNEEKIFFRQFATEILMQYEKTAKKSVSRLPMASEFFHAIPSQI